MSKRKKAGDVDVSPKKRAKTENLDDDTEYDSLICEVMHRGIIVYDRYILNVLGVIAVPTEDEIRTFIYDALHQEKYHKQAQYIIPTCIVGFTYDNRLASAKNFRLHGLYFNNTLTFEMIVPTRLATNIENIKHFEIIGTVNVEDSTGINDSRLALNKLQNHYSKIINNDIVHVKCVLNKTVKSIYNGIMVNYGKWCDDIADMIRIYFILEWFKDYEDKSWDIIKYNVNKIYNLNDDIVSIIFDYGFNNMIWFKHSNTFDKNKLIFIVLLHVYCYDDGINKYGNINIKMEWKTWLTHNIIPYINMDDRNTILGYIKQFSKYKKFPDVNVSSLMRMLS